MLGNSLPVIISKKTILLLNTEQTSIDLPLQKNEKALVKIAKTLKEIIKSKTIIILLSDDNSYTFCLRTTEKPSSQNLMALLKRQIPEDLNENNFSWKLIEKKDDDYLVQIFAVTQKSLNLISELKKQNIKIDFVQSLSYSITQLFKDKKKTSIILDQKPKIQTLALNYRGATLFSTVTNNDEQKTDIKSITNTLKKFDLNKKEINLEKTNLNLSKSPALKLKNNLQLAQKNLATNQVKKKPNASEWLKKHFVLIAVFYLAFLSLVIVLFLKLNKYF